MFNYIKKKFLYNLNRYYTFNNNLFKTFNHILNI